MEKDCCDEGCDCDILASLLAAFRLLLDDVARGWGAEEAAEREARCGCAGPEWLLAAWL